MSKGEKKIKKYKAIAKMLAGVVQFEIKKLKLFFDL